MVCFYYYVLFCLGLSWCRAMFQGKKRNPFQHRLPRADCFDPSPPSEDAHQTRPIFESNDQPGEYIIVVPTAVRVGSSVKRGRATAKPLEFGTQVRVVEVVEINDEAFGPRSRGRIEALPGWITIYDAENRVRLAWPTWGRAIAEEVETHRSQQAVNFEEDVKLETPDIDEVMIHPVQRVARSHQHMKQVPFGNVGSNRQAFVFEFELDYKETWR